MADRSLTRSLPLRPDYDPSAGLETRVAALEDWRAEVDVWRADVDAWRAAVDDMLVDFETRITALENP
jgi:hypothetical protein